ncbi:alpha/beta fold hydrolase [Leisingera sp. ANG-Vp]|uniref:alpha/beta fold hydrolase n=1 Tax=Leisingera sp. ANG-Vp TaxID=1577896 RepID=UPI00057EECC5|nr:alpha/beta hydrolase [Leisingera sp. ANG-Vp]KIC14509.1 alpha/beta hydrolase [Leisingera sp. ANG-Vp]
MSASLLVLAALAWGGTLWKASVNEARAEAAYPPQGRFLQVGGHQVHAVEMGQPQGSAPDLVLIHGSSGNIRDMTFRLAPALADDYRILIFDRPGLGYSSPLGGGDSIRRQAEVLQQAAGQMGAEKPIVLGQSYGGAVALAWAVDHPGSLSALVTVSGVAYPWTTPLDPLYRVTSSRAGSALAVPLLTAFVPRAKVESSLQDVFAPQPAPEGYAAHFGTGLTLRRSSMRANARQRANLLEEVIALSPRYPEIRVPLEVIHGSADDLVSPELHAEGLARNIETANVTLLEGIGHMPHHVATDDVAAAVRRAAVRANLR